MKGIALVVAALGVVCVAAPKPLATIQKFDGKFAWIKLGAIPPTTVKTLSKATSILLDVTFSRDVKIKKDSRGNSWFTFILADQGADWKWNQTKGYGAVPTPGGAIRAGRYTVTIPVDGLPKSVLTEKKQTISVGAATSGLAGAATFSIDSLRGK